MRIDFDKFGREYLEIKESEGGISVVISAQDMGNSRKTLINSVEVSKDDFFKIVSSLSEKD